MSAVATSAAQPSRRNLLQIDDVVVTGADEARVDVMHGSLRADAGDLAIVHVADSRQAEIWADVATGLLAPDKGRVTIMGNDLAELDIEAGNLLRGRIGRVFSRGNWLDRLSVMDNVLIQARHHSGRSDAELAREASALAQWFDLPGIPLGLPDRFTRIELQKSACVRAFLGNPVLVILEDPGFGVREEMVPPLMGAIRAARNRGAAVVWFTQSMEFLHDRSIPAAHRYRMAGSELMAMV